MKTVFTPTESQIEEGTQSLEISIRLDNGYDKKLLLSVFNKICNDIENDKYCSLASFSPNSSNCVYDGERVHITGYNKDAHSCTFFLIKPNGRISTTTGLPSINQKF